MACLEDIATDIDEWSLSDRNRWITRVRAADYKFTDPMSLCNGYTGKIKMIKNGALDALTGGVAYGRGKDSEHLRWANFHDSTRDAVHIGKGKKHDHVIAMRDDMTPERTF